MSDTIRSETLMEDYNKMLRENIKLKEHIKELEAEIVVVKSQKMREFIGGADAELAKRDQLIEQAIVKISSAQKYIYTTEIDPELFLIRWADGASEFLKQAEELKGGK